MEDKEQQHQEETGGAWIVYVNVVVGEQVIRGYRMVKDEKHTVKRLEIALPLGGSTPVSDFIDLVNAALADPSVRLTAVDLSPFDDSHGNLDEVNCKWEPEDVAANTIGMAGLCNGAELVWAEIDCRRESYKK